MSTGDIETRRQSRTLQMPGPLRVIYFKSQTECCMRYAVNSNNERIEVQYSGQRATCESCKQVVIGRKGEIRPPHWSHKSLNDCDSWYEPITAWHIEWQNQFPENNREVYIADNKTNEIHRADIMLDNGLVIEIQHSSIDIDKVKQRESFYNSRKGLIWVLDGSSLAKQSTLSYKFVKKEFTFYLTIPDYLDSVDNYSLDNYRMAIHENGFPRKIIENNELLDWQIQNGSYYILSFKTENSIKEYELLLKDILYNTANDMYGFKSSRIIMDNIEIKTVIHPKDYFYYVNLTKKYWRSFIEYMDSPVFIDNLNGLDKNYLYYYQENKIIKKTVFINKYLKYTTRNNTSA